MLEIARDFGCAERLEPNISGHSLFQLTQLRLRQHILQAMLPEVMVETKVFWMSRSSTVRHSSVLPVPSVDDEPAQDSG